MKHCLDHLRNFVSKTPGFVTLFFVCILSVGDLPVGHAQTSREKLSTLISNALRHEDETVRSNAVRQLGYVRPLTREVVSALIEALQDQSKEVRSAAVYAIGMAGKIGRGKLDISPLIAETVPSLLMILRNEAESQDIRRSTAQTVAQIAPGKREVVSALVRVLEAEGEDQELRVFAATALREMGSLAKAAVPAILDFAREVKSDELREKVWSAIAVIAPDNKEAIQALTKLVEAEGKVSDRFRSYAISTLGEIKAVDAIPMLVGALDDSDIQVRLFAIRALGKMGADAKSVVPELIEILYKPLRGEDLSLKAHAIGALLEIDGKSSQVISAIKDISTNDPEPKIREYAGQVLQKIQAEK